MLFDRHRAPEQRQQQQEHQRQQHREQREHEVACVVLEPVGDGDCANRPAGRVVTLHQLRLGERAVAVGGDGTHVRNDLGIDRCRAIQETGFRQCQNWVFGEEKGIKSCGERRLDDLKRKLAEKAKEEAEAEIAKEEAEKKANMKAEAEDPVPGETSG